MNIVLLMLLLAQFEPEPGFSLAALQGRKQARDDLVHAILSNNGTLAQTALKAKANPENIVILSQDESSALRSLSAKTYFYYSNGTALRPLHLAAGLGETEICQLLLAGGRDLGGGRTGTDFRHRPEAREFLNTQQRRRER